MADDSLSYSIYPMAMVNGQGQQVIAYSSADQSNYAAQGYYLPGQPNPQGYIAQAVQVNVVDDAQAAQQAALNPTTDGGD